MLGMVVGVAGDRLGKALAAAAAAAAGLGVSAVQAQPWEGLGCTCKQCHVLDTANNPNQSINHHASIAKYTRNANSWCKIFLKACINCMSISIYIFLFLYEGCQRHVARSK